MTEEGASPGSYEGFFAAYGAYARAWVKGEDGQISYSGINPGIKEALTQLNAMYEEGLIDPEFGVKDTVKLGEDIAAGKVGMFYGLEGMPWEPARAISKTIRKQTGSATLLFPLQRNLRNLSPM